MASAGQNKKSRHRGWATWQERLVTGCKETACGCWEWTRSKNNRGYGVIYFDGKLHLAHRAAWLMEHGEWPRKGKVIDHICQNKSCINPSHLRELENWQNIRRAYPIDDPKIRRRRELNRAAKARCRPVKSPNYTPFYEEGDENNLVQSR